MNLETVVETSHSLSCGAEVSCELGEVESLITVEAHLTATDGDAFHMAHLFDDISELLCLGLDLILLEFTPTRLEVAPSPNHQLVDVISHQETIIVFVELVELLPQLRTCSRLTVTIVCRSIFVW